MKNRNNLKYMVLYNILFMVTFFMSPSFCYPRFHKDYKVSEAKLGFMYDDYAKELLSVNEDMPKPCRMDICYASRNKSETKGELIWPEITVSQKVEVRCPFSFQVPVYSTRVCGINRDGIAEWEKSDFQEICPDPPMTEYLKQFEKQVLEVNNIQTTNTANRLMKVKMYTSFLQNLVVILTEFRDIPLSVEDVSNVTKQFMDAQYHVVFRNSNSVTMEVAMDLLTVLNRLMDDDLKNYFKDTLDFVHTAKLMFMFYELPYRIQRQPGESLEIVLSNIAIYLINITPETPDRLDITEGFSVILDSNRTVYSPNVSLDLSDVNKTDVISDMSITILRDSFILDEGSTWYKEGPNEQHSFYLDSDHQGHSFSDKESAGSLGLTYPDKEHSGPLGLSYPDKESDIPSHNVSGDVFNDTDSSNGPSGILDVPLGIFNISSPMGIVNAPSENFNLFGDNDTITILPPLPFHIEHDDLSNATAPFPQFNLNNSGEVKPVSHQFNGTLNPTYPPTELESSRNETDKSDTKQIFGLFIPDHKEKESTTSSVQKFIELNDFDNLTISGNSSGRSEQFPTTTTTTTPKPTLRRQPFFTSLGSAVYISSSPFTGRQLSNHVAVMYDFYTCKNRSNCVEDPVCIHAFIHTNWTNRGCTTIDNQVETGYTSCRCNGGLGIFGIVSKQGLGVPVVDLPDIEDKIEVQGGGIDSFVGFPYRRELDILGNILGGISLACLVATVATYSFFRNTMRGTPTVILLNLCGALMMLSVLLISVYFVGDDITLDGCTAANTLRYYLVFVTLVWNGIEAFNMYLMLVKVFNSSISKLAVKAGITAWGVPVVMVIAAYLANKKSFYGKHVLISEAESKCVFKCQLRESTLYFWYLIPMGVIILHNLVMFVFVLNAIIKHGDKLGPSKKKNKIVQLIGAVATLALLGVPWIFSAFGAIHAEGNENLERTEGIFQVVFVIFMNLQGLFIFVFHCVRNAQVRQSWYSIMKGSANGSSSRAFNGSADSPSEKIKRESLKLNKTNQPGGQFDEI